jgi:hypothetical protein
LVSVEIERNDLVPALRANASKNLHFLVVVASLPARGSGDGVRNALSRSVGAIEEVEVVCLHFRIIVDSKIGGFGPCARSSVNHCWSYMLNSTKFFEAILILAGDTSYY